MPLHRHEAGCRRIADKVRSHPFGSHAMEQ